ncbi:hypothetical protein PIB30_055606 [Stylosanthes scabra]|uniref:Uncharacterized protein n=1 Tax=Stylosanthes scabra TaxID=79078 RepID=A0ABU6XKN3_9FABA|nr:hypothetical protein [Stylosanthes scabra]
MEEEEMEEEAEQDPNDDEDFADYFELAPPPSPDSSDESLPPTGFNKQSSEWKWLKRAEEQADRKEKLEGQIQSLCVLTKGAYAWHCHALGVTF